MSAWVTEPGGLASLTLPAWCRAVSLVSLGSIGKSLKIKELASVLFYIFGRGYRRDDSTFKSSQHPNTRAKTIPQIHEIGQGRSSSEYLADRLVATADPIPLPSFYLYLTLPSPPPGIPVHEHA